MDPRRAERLRRLHRQSRVEQQQQQQEQQPHLSSPSLSADVARRLADVEQKVQDLRRTAALEEAVEKFLKLPLELPNKEYQLSKVHSTHGRSVRK